MSDDDVMQRIRAHVNDGQPPWDVVDEEIGRLRTALDRTSTALAAERALADEAADLVANPSFNPGWFTRRNQWLARYRASRGRDE